MNSTKIKLTRKGEVRTRVCQPELW
jgi:hypothetical protein